MVAVVALVFAGAAHAEMCLRAADCTVSQFGGVPSCTKSKLFGIELFFGTCSAPGACNSNAECRTGASCTLGSCQPTVAPGADSQGGGDKGTGVPGEGRHCMPADGSKPADWAQDRFGKPLGACPAGTRCNERGFCVRLES
jgi:hypothetical protein